MRHVWIFQLASAPTDSQKSLILPQLEAFVAVWNAHGAPLAGDPVYGKSCSGDPRLVAFSRQALHAWRLGLVHPATGDLVAWEAPLPNDFAQLLDSVRGDRDA